MRDAGIGLLSPLQLCDIKTTEEKYPCYGTLTKVINPNKTVLHLNFFEFRQVWEYVFLTLLQTSV